MVALHHPAFLWGALACIVPVIIHLLNRHKTRYMDISTVRFFMGEAVNASKTRKLRHLLLLFVRMLIILLLVLLFAQPYHRSDPFAMLTGTDCSVFCWIDPTMSMDYSDNGEALWHKANSLCDSLSQTLAPSSTIALYDNDLASFVPLHTALPAAEQHGDRYRVPDYAALFTLFSAQAHTSAHVPVLVLFSDFQRNATQIWDSLFVNDTTKYSLVCVSCAPQKPVNYSVHSVFPAHADAQELTCVVAAQNKAYTGNGLSAFAGGMRIGQTSAAPGANDTQAVNMHIRPAAGGNTGGYVELDANDGLAYDNKRYFTRTASQSHRVLVVGDSAQTIPIAAALRSVENTPWSPVITKQVQAVSYADIDSASLIVLQADAAVPQPLHLLLLGATFKNKAVIVAPGSLPTPGIAFTEGIVRKKTPVYVHGDKPLSVVLFDTMSLLWKGFPRLRETDAACFDYIDNIAGIPLAGLSNNKPLLTRALDVYGNARILCSVPLGITASNNVYQTGMYVPMLDRLCRYALAAAGTATTEWIAGEPHANPLFGTGRQASVFNEHDELCGQWGSQPYGILDMPGLYQVREPGAAPYWIAVNANNAESNLVYRLPALPAFRTSTGSIVDGHTFLQRLAQHQSMHYSYILWLLIALALAAEIMLWERIPQKKPIPRMKP